MKIASRKFIIASGVIAFVVLCCAVLLSYYPIWRVCEIGPRAIGEYYSEEEIRRALYIGSTSDRYEVMGVLELADRAFSDTTHTTRENEQEYGLLARYATSTDIYGNVDSNDHTLKLWSAHLDDAQGWMWVHYSSESFYADGSLACGSWNIPSLWKLENNGSGEWTVTDIKEHP